MPATNDKQELKGVDLTVVRDASSGIPAYATRDVLNHASRAIAAR
ncbi:MAG: hypothetical protein WBM80_10010 [Woeseiaceae bacterium]